MATGLARSNPKGVVFFAAVLPQFIDRERGSVTSQLILLGGIFAILGILFQMEHGDLLAGTAREWLATDSKRLETSSRNRGGNHDHSWEYGVLYLCNCQCLSTQLSS